MAEGQQQHQRVVGRVYLMRSAAARFVRVAYPVAASLLGVSKWLLDRQATKEKLGTVAVSCGHLLHASRWASTWEQFRLLKCDVACLVHCRAGC